MALLAACVTATRGSAGSAGSAAAIAEQGGLAPTSSSAPHSDSLLLPVKDGGLDAVVAEHKGDVVLVDFWATWCAPCRAELPNLVAIEQKLRDEGFRLITVSADEPEQRREAIAFLDSIKASSPRYIKQSTRDEQFINAIDSAWTGALPALFLYDRKGTRIASFFGERPITEIETAVRSAVRRTPAR